MISIYQIIIQNMQVPTQENLSLQTIIAKQIRMSKLTAINSEHANQMLERAKKLIPLSNHPNLIKIEECFIQEKQSIDPNNPIKHLFIRTQNFNGEKLQLILVNRHMNQIYKIYLQLKSVLEYLHENNFDMTDLSLLNVLIDKSQNMKLQLSCFYKYILGQLDPDPYYNAGSFAYRYKIHDQKSNQITLKLSFFQLMTRKMMICIKCKSSSSFRICKYDLCTQNKLFCMKCDQDSHFFHKTVKIKQRSVMEIIILLQFMQHDKQRINIDIKDKDIDWVLDIFQSIENIEVLHKNYQLASSSAHIQGLYVNLYNNTIYCSQQIPFTFNRYHENRSNEESITQSIYFEQLNLLSLSDEFIEFILESQQKQK